MAQHPENKNNICRAELQVSSGKNELDKDAAINVVKSARKSLFDKLRLWERKDVVSYSPATDMIERLELESAS
jgi:hypothetical protein